MNKHILCLCIISLIATHAFAQPQSGLKISANSTFIKNDNWSTYRPELGFGLIFQQAFKLNKALYLTIGVGYNNYRTTSTRIYTSEYVNIDPVSYDVSDYLSVPITFHYAFNKLYLSAGYQYGFLSDVSFTIADGMLDSNPHDHSAIFGLGYNLHYVSIALEYTLSLNKTIKEGETYWYEPEESDDGELLPFYGESGTKMLRVLQLSVCIPLSKKARK